MKAIIKSIMFLTSLCALSENNNTDNYFFFISCVLVIIWSICSLFKSAINYLSISPIETNYRGSVWGGNNYGTLNGTFRNYKSVSEEKIVKTISNKLHINKNTIIVKSKTENNNNSMMPNLETSAPTKTLSLLPLRDILRNEYEKNNPSTPSEFVSESSIIPTVDEVKVITPMSTVGETPIPTPIKEETTAKVEEETKMEVSIILISNDDKLSTEKIAVYKSIIDAFKNKNMSQSLTYSMLQAITAIDVFSDSITIYISKIPLFKTETISKEELIESMRKSLHEENLAIEIVERKDISVADYYLKNSFY